jgi:RimJ/RimL family protein N-acetyltransferase
LVARLPGEARAIVGPVPTELVPNEPLLTDRLSLEPWSAADTELLGRLASQPEVMRFVGTGTPWTQEHTAEVADRCLEHWRRHGFGWRVAVERETGSSLGFIALNFAGDGAGIAPDEYEIGWWLEPSAWGRGLAREGAGAVREEAFGRLAVPSVVARISPDNAASLGVAGAIGMTPEGRAPGGSASRSRSCA